MTKTEAELTARVERLERELAALKIRLQPAVHLIPQVHGGYVPRGVVGAVRRPPRKP